MALLIRRLTGVWCEGNEGHALRDQHPASDGVLLNKYIQSEQEPTASIGSSYNAERMNTTLHLI